MEVNHSNRGWWRRRRTVGSLMIAIAVLCGILTLARPLATPAPIRAAEAVLRQIGPLGFDPRHYRIDQVQRANTGYWNVTYARVSGSGPPNQNVVVSDQLVRSVRFNPWYALPPIGSTPTPFGPRPFDPNLDVVMPRLVASPPQPAPSATGTAPPNVSQ